MRTFSDRVHNLADKLEIYFDKKLDIPNTYRKHRPYTSFLEIARELLIDNSVQLGYRKDVCAILQQEAEEWKLGLNAELDEKTEMALPRIKSGARVWILSTGEGPFTALAATATPVGVKMRPQKSSWFWRKTKNPGFDRFINGAITVDAWLLRPTKGDDFVIPASDLDTKPPTVKIMPKKQGWIRMLINLFYFFVPFKKTKIPQIESV